MFYWTTRRRRVCCYLGIYFNVYLRQLLTVTDIACLWAGGELSYYVLDFFCTDDYQVPGMFCQYQVPGTREHLRVGYVRIWREA